MDRDNLITALFDTMDIAKRSMRGRLLSVTSGQNISHTQLELLFTIKHLQPVGSKLLAERLHLTPGAVSQLMDALDQQGFIVRKIDPSDRRRQTLHVSGQGISLLKTVEKKRRSIMQNVIRDLSDEELLTWLHIQRKLIDEFQAINTTTEKEQS